MNIAIFKAINGLVHECTLLDKIMILFSKYVPLVFIIGLAVLYLCGVHRKDKRLRCIAISTFVITVINLFISYMIGIFYYEPRPFVNYKVNLLLPHAVDASFPSDHAIGTMSIALGITNHYRIYGRILILISFLVGVSRIYVGHHFPMDVLGSYFIVLISNYVYMYVLQDKINEGYLKIEEFLIKYVTLTK
ncbi:phosphatase [Caloranaerobacter sp. TR13]|nr:phosphatase [Caloranaerobacter sp. TR13]